MLLPAAPHEIHDVISVTTDNPFGPNIGFTIPSTPSELTATINPLFYFQKLLTPSYEVFRYPLVRKNIAENTRSAYVSTYEHFQNAYPSTFGSDPDSPNQTLAYLFE